MTNPTHKEKPCGECGKLFKYKVCYFKERQLSLSPGLCDKCLKAVREQERQDIDEKWLRSMEEQWFKICPPLYRDSDVTRFPPAWKTISRWKPNPKGLLLHGSSGTFKTRMVYAMLRPLYMAGTRIMVFGPTDFRTAYSGKLQTSMDAASYWLDTVIRVDVVFFDDWEKMKFTETTQEGLFAVVEKRTANLKPLIITTNLTAKGLREKMDAEYSGPLIRRLTDFCEIVSC